MTMKKGRINERIYLVSTKINVVGTYWTRCRRSSVYWYGILGDLHRIYSGGVSYCGYFLGVNRFRLWGAYALWKGYLMRKFATISDFRGNDWLVNLENVTRFTIDRGSREISIYYLGSASDSYCSVLEFKSEKDFNNAVKQLQEGLLGL